MTSESTTTPTAEEIQILRDALVKADRYVMERRYSPAEADDNRLRLVEAYKVLDRMAERITKPYPEQPPISNDYVAEGCERFSE